MGASECGPEWPSPCLMRHPGAAPPQPTVDGAVRGSFRATRPLARWSRTPSPPQAACVGLGQCSSAHDFRRQGRLGEPCPLAAQLLVASRFKPRMECWPRGTRKKKLPAACYLAWIGLTRKTIAQTPATPNLRQKERQGTATDAKPCPAHRTSCSCSAGCLRLGRHFAPIGIGATPLKETSTSRLEIARLGRAQATRPCWSRVGAAAR